VKVTLTSIGLSVLLTICAASCAPRGSDVYYPTENWRHSSAGKQGMDSAGLEEIDALVKSSMPLTSSVLVIRHGSIVFERYYRGDETTRRTIWSVTKVFLSTLVGIAIDQRLIEGPDQKLVDLLPEYRDSLNRGRAAGITVRHLLTMSDGISREENAEPDIGEVVKGPPRADPGTEFFYNLVSPQILSMVITKTAGTSVLDFGISNLFTIMGIRDVLWESRSGFTIGGYGLHLTTRDIAKLGYLYLKGGVWEGKQIVSREWVAESTRQQIETGYFWRHLRGYGYYWYTHAFGSHPAYIAFGLGGQCLVVIPDLDLITVITTEDDEAVRGEQYLYLLDRSIIPSIREKSP
jgi:CubicO group peptidase (beta-lactamase class C family)